MFPTRSAARRSTVSVAALLGAAALLFSSVGPATAAPGPANISSQTGSITIHKLEQSDAGGDSGHQGEKRDVAGTPLSGVEFTVSRFNGIDLATAEGWNQIEGISVGSELPKTAVDKVVTDGNGIATAANLPLGLYLVEETNSGENNVIEPVDPFLVSLPTSGPQNEWLYDVHAYPKNSVVTIDLDVDDSAASIIGDGRSIIWTVETAIPRLPAKDAFTEYSLIFDLDDRLKLVSEDEIALTLVGVAPIPRSAYSLNVQGHTVTVHVNDQYREFLNDFPGAKVQMTVPTTVESNEAPDGLISTTATLSVNNNNGFSATATTKWGAVKIISRASDSGPSLAGATYEVRLTQNGEPLTFGNQKTFTTTADGHIIIPGLRAGQQYWIAELNAAPGYVKTDAVKPLNVSAAGVSTMRGDNPRESNIVTFTNQQVSGFVLPITGSFGSLPFILAGLLLVATALVVNRSRRRRLAQAV